MVYYIMRATRALARPSYRVGSISRRSMMAMADKIKAKEKVEEDRYMRAQEEAWKEKLRNLKAQEEHEREVAHYEDVVRPVMNDLSKMLEGTGDSVSDEGLEMLSKWKLDL